VVQSKHSVVVAERKFNLSRQPIILRYCKISREGPGVGGINQSFMTSHTIADVFQIHLKDARMLKGIVQPLKRGVMGGTNR
jgi:hypothetical protein